MTNAPATQTPSIPSFSNDQPDNKWSKEARSHILEWFKADGNSLKFFNNHGDKGENVSGQAQNVRQRC
jgi:hypothetical protein